jgi:hypothetical protein
VIVRLCGLLDSWTLGLLDSWTPGLLDSWTVTGLGRTCRPFIFFHDPATGLHRKYLMNNLAMVIGIAALAFKALGFL